MRDSGFGVLDAREPAQRARWLELWSRWPDREVHAHPDYVQLFTGSDDVARAAIYEDDRRAVLYPFIERALPPELRGEHARADLTSPYGYGGPYAWGEDIDELAPAFWAQFDAWARVAGVVAEFVRFAVRPAGMLPYVGETTERLQNIIVPTDTPADVLWRQHAHKVRKNVNKARARGVEIVVDSAGERLGDFLRIYVGTLSRREARESYFFPASFFERLAASLPDQITYFHALLDGRVISTELALISAHRIYSFLGGTDESYFDARPNDLLKHEMINWARSHGKREFVLGGGYAPDDGIFRYKRDLFPDGVVPFFTGQRILDPGTYERLTRMHRERLAPGEPDPRFFPAYRAPRAASNVS